MASTSLSSHKITLTTSSAPKHRANESTGTITASESSKLSPAISVQQTVASNSDDDNEQGSSGDEWGMEIGDLIIDLDADLEKDEMKEKNGNTKSDGRNLNNNNSIKSSNSAKSPSYPQSSKTGPATSVTAGNKSEAANVAKNMKGGSGIVSTSQSSGKSKSKSKKSNKSSTTAKQQVATPVASAAGLNAKGQVDAAAGKDPASGAPNVKGLLDLGSIHSNTLSTTPSPTSCKGKNSEMNAPDGNSVTKPGVKSSKPGRSYKKHSKNSERKGDAGPTPMTSASGKEVKDSKINKSNKTVKHQNVQPSGSSAPNTSLVSTAYVTPSPSAHVTGAGANVKGRRSNSPSFAAVSKFQNHCNAMPSDSGMRTSATAATSNNTDNGKSFVAQSCEAPVSSTVAQSGKHRKTSSLPAPMKQQAPNANITTGSSPAHTRPQGATTTFNSPLSSTADQLHAIAVSGGKRDRHTASALLTSAGNKKIKLEKDVKPYTSSATTNDTDIASKAGNTVLHGDMLTAVLSSSSHYSGSRDHLVAGTCGNRMPGLASSGQHKLLAGEVDQVPQMNAEMKMSSCGVSSAVRNSFSSAFAKPSHAKAASTASSLTVQVQGSTANDTNVIAGDARTNCVPNGALVSGVKPSTLSSVCCDDGGTKRTLGTVTTYDVGVATEPESLGPCEPGTSVHLDGIVWHETESGVLVVNVTWRNRSYVGTLLDATKHDWAPPRIPDADSDVELRAKSGRPKRQRGGNGGNGSGGDSGRKGRKSAVANNGDDYKNSPSNKRRSAKMSESDACSGNDGEICTTPSKSAKRARITSSRNAASSKQSHQRNSATGLNAAKESTSGEGTSGSGSSSCSSPVLMECPYANCEKKYNNNNAMKYHEAHAHCQEDASGAEEAEKSSQDVDSPVADSPKDSDNMSTKSAEELPASESTGSPNNMDSDNLQNEVNNNYQPPMETASATQVPFVVTQNQEVGLKVPVVGHYDVPSLPNHPAPAVTNCREHMYHHEKEQGKDYNSHASNNVANTDPIKLDETEGTDEMVSPYALTDAQDNDSISLKTHPRILNAATSYNAAVSTPAYGESMTTHTTEVCTVAEPTSAVDSESAQAVKTLLQLQDSQDQLPGLTPYNQAAQTQAIAVSGQSSRQAVSASTSSSDASGQTYVFGTLPSERSVPRQQASAAQVQTTAAETRPTPQNLVQPFRSHGGPSEGMSALLPRMSVGISATTSGSTIGQQYVVSVGGYAAHAHGTVTTNPSQEGGALYTSSGVKMAKGKTVPIPTDPHQTPGNHAQLGTPSVSSSATGSNGKRTKRKKAKIDATRPVRQSPTEGVINKPTSLPSVRSVSREDALASQYAMQEQSAAALRVKQEPSAMGGLYQQQQTGASGNHKVQTDVTHMISGASKPLSVQGAPGSARTAVKSEPGSKVQTQGPSHSRNSSYASGASHHQAHHPYLQRDHTGSTYEQPQAPQPASNKNVKQMPISRPSDHVPASVSQFTGPRNTSLTVPDASDDAAIDRRDPQVLRKEHFLDGHPKSNLPSGSSHSLPGSRSLTPVSRPPSHPHYRHIAQTNRDSNTPSKPQTPVSSSSQLRRHPAKDSTSPLPPLERRVSIESPSDSKQVPMSLQRAYAMQHLYAQGIPYQYGYLPAGYDIGTYQAKYMNDPQFQQHYEQVIQHEMQKGLLTEQQRLKDEQDQGGVLAGQQANISRVQPSPSPSVQNKPIITKASPLRPAVDERAHREESPFKDQRQLVPPGPGVHAQSQSAHRMDRGSYGIHGTQQSMQPSRTDSRTRQARVSPVPSLGSYPPTPNKHHLLPPSSVRGLSPHPRATPPPMAGSRPPRPSSETERVHRRETVTGERPSTATRVSTVTPGRKISDPRPQSPDNPRSGPQPPTSVYGTPTLPVQAIPPGAHTPVPYFAAQFRPQIFDPYAFTAVPPGYAMYPHGTPIFPGHWPPGAAPSSSEKPLHSPLSVKPQRERSPSGSRSPYREENERRSHGEVRCRETGGYSSSKERRTSDGPTQIRKSVTPDPKSVPLRNQPIDSNTGSTSPPTQRHLHTHHHIHEGFPMISAQYPFPGPIPMASAVMTGTEAAAALAPFPKRDLS